MTIEPLIQASVAIQIHVFAAIAAGVLGAFVFFRRKGTPAHRLAGRVWVLLMVVVSVLSFAIHEINLWGRWSPVHILSIATLISLAVAIYLARRGMIRSHKSTMISTYAGALLIAGTLSFLPGRIMHEVAAGISDTAGRTTGFVIATIADTPPWVWPLLAGLLFLGWMRSRDRIVSRWQLIATPVVVAALSLFNLYSAGLSLAVLAGFAAGAIPGIAFGTAVGTRDNLVPTGDGKVPISGEWLSMTVLLGVFLIRYANGFMAAAFPAMHADPVWLFSSSAASGFLASLVIAQALAQLQTLKPVASGSRV
ncbi:MAG: DUF2306 domain-containing protein [Hyphomicrobiales bacterium]|nr:DUF2306 domain-containing protein [Hyphomicrobiales bacterium]MCP4999285.1 DUF2306 domain-containing protein [Hyphomicrobiales bacterium]